MLQPEGMQRSRVVLIGAAGAALLICCESAPQPAPSIAEPGLRPVSPTRGSQHAMMGRELERAVADGRLGDLRDAARSLATQQLDEATLAAAQRIERAPDVIAASAELGGLARACGGCHAARGVTIAVTREVLPANAVTLAGQMRHHQWAATRLWEGVSGPTDDAWADGVRVMATTRFAVAQMMHEKPNVEVVELNERYSDQVMRARTLADQDARAALLGDLMATCAGCHRIVHPQPIATPTD